MSPRARRRFALALLVASLSPASAPAHKAESRCGYVDTTGRVVIAPRFVVAEPFVGGRARVCLSGDGAPAWTFIDRKGRVITRTRFADAGPFSEGLARVEVDGKWGYLDRGGRVVIAPRYSDAGEYISGLAPVARGGRWTGLDAEGGPTLVGAKWGAIDGTGRAVIPIEFSAAETSFQGTIRVLGRSGWVYYGPKGTVVPPPSPPAPAQPYAVPFVFASEGRLADGLTRVGVGPAGFRREGFIDPAGRMVIAPSLDSADDFSEGLAWARRGAQSGVIDTSGAWVFLRATSSHSRFAEGLASFCVTR
jgi:hypothetical protein